MSDGTGRIYKRGKVYWIDYSYRGKRHRESSGSTKKKDAKALLRDRMAEIAGGRLIGPAGRKVTVADLKGLVIDDYRIKGQSTRRFDSCFEHVEAFFEGEYAVDITPARLRSYVAHRLDEGAAPATAKRELAGLRRGYTLAQELGMLAAAPKFPTFKIDNAREGFLTMGQVEAVCAELTDDLAPVVRFAAYTGWRKSEYLPLRWRQVDFEAGVVRLEPGSTKNREGREFPFAALPDLEAVLRSQRDRTDAVERAQDRIVPYVFHRKGKPIKSMRRAWKGACKRAGVPPFLMHDLRRTAVRNLERAGVGRSVAMDLTGHKTEHVYSRYAIGDSVARHEGVEKLATFHDQHTDRTRDVLPIQAKGGK